MAILVTCLLLLLGLSLIVGLLRVLHEWVERNGRDVPIFHDPGPIYHDQTADYRDARSQFVWQSRSHFRRPD
jgi:hypothetical protein